MLAGDGRSDSPGHSAKYGSYSILELTCNKIVDVQVYVHVYMHVNMLHVYMQVQYMSCCVPHHLQSNEVSSSNQMEKEGLDRVLQFIKEKYLTVGILLTDRHLQISKLMREQHPNVNHYFDVWHVAKGEHM